MTLFDRPKMRADEKPVSNATLLTSGASEVFPEPVVPLTINTGESLLKNSLKRSS